jgi:hypothetical protein
MYILTKNSRMRNQNACLISLCDEDRKSDSWKDMEELCQLPGVWLT